MTVNTECIHSKLDDILNTNSIVQVAFLNGIGGEK